MNQIEKEPSFDGNMGLLIFIVWLIQAILLVLTGWNLNIFLNG